MKKIIIIAFLVSLQWNTKAQTMNWVRQIGGYKIDRALAITIDAAGNTYTTGQFLDTVDLDPGAGVANAVGTTYGSAFILKLDAAGNYVKSMTFGGTYYTHQAIGSNIALDASANMYVGGYFYGNIDFDPDTSSFIINSSGGDYNAFVTKLDATGKFMWTKSWKYNKDAGLAVEEGPSMVLDGAANLYFTGRFKGTVDFDPGTGISNLPGRLEDGYITKLDSDGNFLWARHLATDTNLAYIHPKSISVDAAGNTYVAGSFYGGVDFNPDSIAVFKITSQSLNGFIVKLDAAGNFVWAKRLGNDADPVFEYHQGNAVMADAAGNAYVTGSFMGTVDFGSIQLTTAGLSDIFIAKIDASGNFVWAKQMGSMYDGEAGSRITLDAAGNVYTTGTYRGTTDFNAGAGVNNLTTNGYTDVFVLKLTSSGDFVWAKGYGGSGNNERIQAIAVKGNDVYTVGRFTKTMNFDPNGTYNLTALFQTYEYSDVFIHKMNQGATGIHEAGVSLYARIFPNPTTGKFYIDLKESGLTNADVIVMDIQGRKVLERVITANNNAVNMEGLPKGMYLVRIQGGNSHSVSKLVLE